MEKGGMFFFLFSRGLEGFHNHGQCLPANLWCPLPGIMNPFNLLGLKTASLILSKTISTNFKHLINTETLNKKSCQWVLVKMDPCKKNSRP